MLLLLRSTSWKHIQPHTGEGVELYLKKGGVLKNSWTYFKTTTPSKDNNKGRIQTIKLNQNRDCERQKKNKKGERETAVSN